MVNGRADHRVLETTVQNVESFESQMAAVASHVQNALRKIQIRVSNDLITDPATNRPGTLETIFRNSQISL